MLYWELPLSDADELIALIANESLTLFVGITLDRFIKLFLHALS
jgi:hypothetical protein